VPPTWAATPSRPGVARLDDLSEVTADAVAARATSAPGAVAVVSIHWGGNWGYAVGAREVAFARRLVERGVHVVHGHSSHHPRRVDVIDGQPVLYGCGELLDDYEGISGYEAFRPDLVLLWLVDLGEDGALTRLEALPMRIRRLRLERASDEEVAWLARTHGLVAREGRLTLQ
jgi:poly-gamma-glutamate capsule biosynthesis protein CapA/YwtB (metallophosphatase superfamily)